MDFAQQERGFDDKVIMPDLSGMPLLRALQYIKKLKLPLGEIFYREAEAPNFTILSQSIKPETELKPGQVVNLRVASMNPIGFLPSIYQGNEQLKNFLWIFQHIFNSITFKLDNIHRYFNPIEAPRDFYKWLASWFSINVNYTITEEKMRYLIKDIVSLYQWRGTAAGLARYLEIITDVKPEILEDYVPHKEYLIKSDRLIENYILEKNRSQYTFTVYFPVKAGHFDLDTIKKINQIIESEKPAHAHFYLIFKTDKEKEKKTTLVIGKDMFK